MLETSFRGKVVGKDKDGKDINVMDKDGKDIVEYPVGKEKAKKYVMVNGQRYRVAGKNNNPGNLEIAPQDKDIYAGTLGTYTNERDIAHLSSKELNNIIESGKNIPRTFINKKGDKDYKMNAFIIFDHKILGLRGMAKDITSKIRDGLTLEQIVRKYAPAKDNEYQAQYIEYVVANTAKYTNLNRSYFDLGGDLDTDKIVEAIIKSKTEFENKGIAFEVDGKFIPATEYYDADSIKKGVQLRETTYDKSKRYLGEDGIEEYFSDKVAQQKDNSLYLKDTPDLTAADFGFHQENIS